MSSTTWPTQNIISPFQRKSTAGFSREAEYINDITSDIYTQFTSASSTRTFDQRFESLKRRWEQDVSFISSASGILTNPAYLEIISMGKDVLPLIFQDLMNGPGHWFMALKIITGVDPVSDESKGDLKAMTDTWLNWGKEHGYVSRL